MRCTQSHQQVAYIAPLGQGVQSPVSVLGLFYETFKKKNRFRGKVANGTATYLVCPIRDEAGTPLSEEESHRQAVNLILKLMN